MKRRFRIRAFPLLALSLLATTLALPARAHDAAACRNPTWAPTPMPGFKIDACDHKDWNSVDVELPAGTKTLQGKFTSVEYALPGENGPSAEAVKQYQIKAAQAAGARLQSDPGAPYQAVLMRKSPHGETWYIYDHGSGNDESTLGYTLTTVEIASATQYVVVRRMTKPLDTQARACTNPPWLVKQFPQYKRSDCTARDFDSIKLDLPDGERTLAGRMLDVNYTLTDDNKDMVARAVRDNYINALEKLGAKLVSDPDNEFQAVLVQKTAQGTLWYIYNHGSGSSDSTSGYALTTVQVGGPQPKACTLEVYGVHFDTDKASLRPESTPVLQQVLAMLKDDSTTQFEIGGHTDDVGSNAHNLTLSDARAKAVVDWLVAHGTAASRLTSHGYGETRPLVPNTSDKNRARNRRVEMKNRNCAGHPGRT